jgi:hypothetical protein
MYNLTLSSFLCHTEFAIYLQYVRKLGFEEAPDYDFLRELFSKVLKDEADGTGKEPVFDWILLDQTQVNIENMYESQ